MFENLKADAHQRLAATEHYDEGISRLLSFVSRTWLATCVYRFGRFAGDAGPKPIKLMLKALYYPVFFITQGITGISIQAHCRIGKGFAVNGNGGVFILAEKIGENFTVGSGVTVGNVRGSKTLPVIGDNVYIEPGAKILGSVTIGSNVIIRGNSLVLTDIPDDTMAIGNPARIKKKTQAVES